MDGAGNAERTAVAVPVRLGGGAEQLGESRVVHQLEPDSEPVPLLAHSHRKVSRLVSAEQREDPATPPLWSILRPGEGGGGGRGVGSGDAGEAAEELLHGWLGVGQSGDRGYK